jgi:hypothetical protein
MGHNQNEIHEHVVHHSKDVNLNAAILYDCYVSKPYQKVYCDPGLIQEGCHECVDSEAL